MLKIMPSLSEQLNKLSERIASIETNAKDALQDSSIVGEAAISAAIEGVKTGQVEFNRALSSADSELGQQWQEVQDSFQANVDLARTNIQSTIKNVDISIAEGDAEVAETYASNAIAFAELAAREAEVAVLNAVSARQHADSLK